MRSRNNEKIILNNKSLLEDTVNEKRDAWRDAWLAVDRMLDPVLIKSGFLKPYPEATGDAVSRQATKRRDKNGRFQVNVTSANRQSGTTDRPQKRSRVVTDIAGKQQAVKTAELMYREYRDNFGKEAAKARSKSAENGEPRGSGSVADKGNEAKARDDFRQRIWRNKVEELGRGWEQKRDDMRSAQLRAIESQPELESSLSIQSSYFNVTKDGVWRSGESGRVKLMEACQGWRQIAARKSLGGEVNHSVSGANYMNDGIYKYPVRLQDSSSRQWIEYGSATKSGSRQRSPCNPSEARKVRLTIWRSKLRPSAVGLSSLEGFRRAAMRQKSMRKSKTQCSLHSRGDAPRTNVQDRDHHGYRQYSTPASEVNVGDQTNSHVRKGGEHRSQRDQHHRAASYSRRSAEVSRRHSCGRREDVETGSDDRLSDRGAKLYRGRPDRESFQGRSNASYANERQRDLMKRAAAEAKERVRRSRPLGRERRTAMEIIRKGPRRP